MKKLLSIIFLLFITIQIGFSQGSYWNLVMNKLVPINSSWKLADSLITGTRFLLASDSTGDNGYTKNWKLGGYQPISNNLTIYAGITPSADAQTLLSRTFAQMRADIGASDSTISRDTTYSESVSQITEGDNITVEKHGKGYKINSTGGSDFNVCDSTLVFNINSFPGVDATGADTCQTSIRSAIDYVTSLGGKIYFPPTGIYLVRGRCLNYQSKAALNVETVIEAGINLPSNAHLILDGTIQVMTDTLAINCPILISNGVKNVTIEGRGKIRGDRTTHDFTKDQEISTTHEFGHLIVMGNCDSIVIRDINLVGATGDGICIYRQGQVYLEYFNYTRNFPTNVLIDNVQIDSCRRVGINNCFGEYITIRNCKFNYIGIDDGYEDGVAPRAAINHESGRGKKAEHIKIEGGFSVGCSGGVNLFDANYIVCQGFITDAVIAMGYACNGSITGCVAKSISSIGARPNSHGEFTYAGDSLSITTDANHGYSVGDSVSMDILVSTTKYKIAGGTFVITSSAAADEFVVHKTSLGATSGYVRLLGRYTVTDDVVHVEFPYTHDLGPGEPIHVTYRHSDGIVQYNGDGDPEMGNFIITSIDSPTNASKGYSYIDADVTTSAGALYDRFIENNFEIANNTITNGGIVLAGHNVNCHHNIIQNAENGIYATAFFNGKISNNIISNVNKGIYASIVQTEISENKIYSSGSTGIQLTGGRDITLSGNKIYDSYRGIYITGCSAPRIIDNTIDVTGFTKTSANDGIYISASDSARILLQGNKLINYSGSQGFDIDAKADIINNYIIDFKGTTAIDLSVSGATRQRNNIMDNYISFTRGSAGGTGILTSGDSLAIIKGNTIWTTNSNAVTTGINTSGSVYSAIKLNVLRSGAMTHHASDTLQLNLVGDTFDPPLPGLYKHFYALIDTPLYRYTQDSIIALTYKTTEAITIAGIQISCDADPTTEIAGNLVYADDLITRANPVIINSVNTATGVLTDVSITSASVAAGKAIYLRLTAEPDAATKWVCVDVVYKAAGY